MSDYTESNPDPIHAKLFAWMKDTLEVSDVFMNRLSSDDDWSFLIKTHALVEAALNHILVLRFGSPETQKIVEQMQTSNQKSGKSAFAKAFGILAQESLKFIQILSELRNNCAHHVKNYHFDIRAYLSKFNDDQKKSWLDCLTHGMAKESKGSDMTVRQAFWNDPRMAILSATTYVVLQCLIHEKDLNLMEAVSDARAEKAKQLDELRRTSAKE